MAMCKALTGSAVKGLTASNDLQLTPWTPLIVKLFNEILQPNGLGKCQNYTEFNCKPSMHEPLPLLTIYGLVVTVTFDSLTS